MSRIRDTVLIALMLGAIVALVHYVTGCGPTAEARYTDRQLECVNKAPTREASHACRRAVDAEFHVDGGTR